MTLYYSINALPNERDQAEKTKVGYKYRSQIYEWQVDFLTKNQHAGAGSKVTWQHFSRLKYLGDALHC